ncbi:MAG: 50S ribosomal protein L4 [Candidatus Uhrbacteria bacterium]|nr:50S ribosomal protein L4 [Candidatus Uhrbacteria bacterium]
MAKVKLFTWEGTETGTYEVPDSLFAVEPNGNIIHQAVLAQEANSRLSIADTKDRSEVSGGGKKPWKQKGTGRARHGSSRSPIWVGGGVTHGPITERNFSVKINKKTKRLALAMAISDKVKDGAFIAIEDFNIPEAKTKHLAAMRKALPGATHSALIVVTKDDVAVKRAAANLPKTETIHAHSLNVRDLVKYRTVVASKAAIDAMVATFTG